MNDIIKDNGGENNNELHDLNFYKFVIHSLPIAVLTVDSEFSITGFNPWAEKITGYSEEAVIGEFCNEILRGGLCERDCPLKTVLERKKTMTHLESTIHNKEGDILPVRLNISSLVNDKGTLVGAVETFQDISRLKSMEREKDNLISMFAHDMKSSITIIGGFALRLLKKATRLTAEKKESYYKIIKQEAGNLEFIVEDFLEFSRLQTGKLKLNFSPTSLDKELMELFDAYQAKAIHSGIDFEFQDDEALPIIEADANRLRRVFMNLLDNAFKFSNKNDKVLVTTLETDTELVARIKDHGKGIYPEDLPYIFDAFHRGRGTRKEEGSGVGLAAAKAIVEAHGGQIKVDSKLGKGTAFTVFLPKIRNPQNEIPLE